MNKSTWLSFVHTTIKENPAWIGDTVQACNLGLEESYQELMRAKSEIECALSFSLHKSFKKDSKKFIKDKLILSKKYLSLKWDWFLEEDN